MEGLSAVGTHKFYARLSRILSALSLLFFAKHWSLSVFMPSYLFLDFFLFPVKLTKFNISSLFVLVLICRR
jgi:hypothetical protein